MKDIKRVAEILIFWLSISIAYFLQGMKNRRFFSHVKNYVKEFFLHLETFSKHIHEHKDIEDLQTSKYERLKQATLGLHQLLTDSDRFSYSILLVVDDCPNQALRTTLESALNLTAPNYEVLVGIKKQTKENESLIQEFKSKNSNKLIVYDFYDKTNTSIINSLVENSKNKYLFIAETGDWLRPDLLYRYEQTLHFFPDPEKTVLFCEEYLIDSSLTPIPGTRSHKPEIAPFPYVFNDDFGRTLLIPKKLWNTMDGLQEAYEGLHLFELSLRLYEAGAQFQKVPVYLYGTAQKNKIKKNQSYEHSKELLNLFENFSKRQKLNWHWEKGLSQNSVRAIPTLQDIPTIHVVILYKNQHNLTISSVKHIKQQVGVQIHITAIDNNSSDQSIAKKLEELGVEVIRVEEPFNYSRLNNIAVNNSEIGKRCENILFLNNDVDLDKSALLEMCKWINQPGIGLVGCRLNYPNGTLQHGGVIIESSRAAFIKSWHHIERTEKFKRLEKTNFLRVTAAVTAACCLIKRSTFMEVGGFDEKWFPIAFSDTALAVKVRAKGLHCFYTPFAVGVHHESISRKKINIEDYESLTWAHRKFVQNLWNDQKIHFDELKNVEY